MRGNDGIALPLQHGFFRFYVLDSRLRGNDESIHTETCTTSFPRTYIPSFPQNRNLKSRHSRAGGNPDLSVRTLIG
ncbi:hypothetical protein E4O68_08215 [Neisseria meningitidis]|nr:hypothetical protein [Neisseria meningitidis]